MCLLFLKTRFLVDDLQSPYLSDSDDFSNFLNLPSASSESNEQSYSANASVEVPPILSNFKTAIENPSVTSPINPDDNDNHNGSNNNDNNIEVRFERTKYIFYCIFC